MSNGKEGQTGWVIHHLGGVIYVWKAENRGPGPPSLALTAAKAKSIANPCKFRWPRNQEQMLTSHAYQQSLKKKKIFKDSLERSNTILKFQSYSLHWPVPLCLAQAVLGAETSAQVC